jgi:glycosyltransferase involved in cell wall biosynthesis
MASIIIPAHNEESVIGRNLATLLENLVLDDIEILVICNGCNDATAAIARDIGAPITVIEVDRASKTEALNVGDSMAGTYPRIYLDADVEIDGGSIRRVIDHLRRPGALAAEPEVRIDVNHSTLPVKAYYSVWIALHGQSPGDIGGGLYALSIEGRRRFGPFPDVIADDAYARAHFDSMELARVVGATSVVRAPERAGGLLQIKTRSRLGIMELRSKYPELWEQKTVNTMSLATKALMLPLRVWPAVPMYVALQLLAKWRAKKLANNLDSYTWQRDDSSRKRQG